MVRYFCDRSTRDYVSPHYLPDFPDRASEGSAAYYRLVLVSFMPNILVIVHVCFLPSGFRIYLVLLHNMYCTLSLSPFLCLSLILSLSLFFFSLCLCPSLSLSIYLSLLLSLSISLCPSLSLSLSILLSISHSHSLYPSLFLSLSQEFWRGRVGCS